MELTEGASVAGKYRLDRRIGVGGMGEVWSATQTLTRQAVALKFLHDGGSTEDARRRFIREARAACAVRHPNVVEIHDILELEGGAPVMVMELLRGESLEQRLKREGRLSLGDLSSVVLRVVSAVGAAHALGIVHRDLKPENIFLAETPVGVDVKVLDFGIAKLTALDGDAAQTGGLTSTGAMLGTPFYMSPEQAFGEKQLDHRADIWSLGIILYRGLSGVLPTQADNIGQILKIIMTRAIPKLADVAPGLPADVSALVDRMLESDPEARPADLREVKAVLERYAGVSVEAFPAPTQNRAESVSQARGAASSAGTPSVVSAPSKVVPVVLTGVAIAALAAAAILLVGPSDPVTPEAPVSSAEDAVSIAPAVVVAPLPESSVPTPDPVASAAPLAARPSASGALRPGARPPASSVATAAAAHTVEPAKSAAPSLGGVIEKPTF